jgi:hypothetical protein
MRIGERPLLGCVQGKPRGWVVERANTWRLAPPGGSTQDQKDLIQMSATVVLPMIVFAFGSVEA